MIRIFYILFALIGYGLFGVSFTYYMGWLVGDIVPWTSNQNAFISLTDNIILALGIDIVLIAMFLIPHTIMARPAFKKWWVTIIPPPIERSFYVWYSSLALMLMMALWQPVSTSVWMVEGILANALYGVFIIGVLILVSATFCIDHFELFGLKQVFTKKKMKPSFIVRYIYKVVRHPIALGNILIVWGTPTMSLSHLLYSVLSTIYVLIATFKYEERDLIDAIGDDYVEYIKTTPGICPIKFGK